MLFRFFAALGFTETDFTVFLGVDREVLLDELDLFTTVLLILILGIFGGLTEGEGRKRWVASAAGRGSV